MPGVTRKSIIQLARQLGYDVQETDVPVAEAMQADEIFTTGTAVVVSAVGSLTYQVRPLLLPDLACQCMPAPCDADSMQYLCLMPAGR